MCTLCPFAPPPPHLNRITYIKLYTYYIHKHIFYEASAPAHQINSQPLNPPTPPKKTYPEILLDKQEVNLCLIITTKQPHKTLYISNNNIYTIII